MLNKNTLVTVINRADSVVGYTIPDLGNLNRQFQLNESKEITFEELKKLSYIPGGDYILKNCLLIKNEEAVKELGINPELEYYYSEKDIKNLLVNGSMDEFLDCLDFAPEGVIDLIKKLAVELEINDIRKREAILNKTNFNVTRAIEINREVAEETEENKETFKRRVSKENKEESEGGTGRRVAPPKYKRV